MITLRHAMWMGATGALGLTLAAASCNGGSTTPDPTAPAPTLTAVTPPLGPTSGTTTLTLTGTNFTSGTTVQIGAAMATGVAFVSPTQLTAVLPAQPTAFGKVPVVVARPDGQTATSSDLFGYFAVNVDFAAGSSLAAGNQPAAAAAGDFNGDGKMDLIVGNQASADLSLLLSTTGGTLSPQAAISTGNAPPAALAVGDLNGDQKLDIAFITNMGTDVSVLLGNGSGGFSAPTKYPAGTGNRALILADLNGDKSPDAVVVNNSQGVSVLLSTKDGKLGAAAPFSAGTLPSGVAAGDFNGDGKADVIISDVNSNFASILIGSGDGKLGTATQVNLMGPTMAVTAGDFNGDGKLDAAYLTGTGVVMSPGNGSGAFLTPTPAAVGTSPYGLSSGDVNGDGITDLVVIDIATYKAFVFVSSATGLGTPKMYGTGMSPAALALGDFDGDKRPDIAVANQASNDVTLLNNKSQ